MSMQLHSGPSWMLASLLLAALILPGCGLTQEAKEARSLERGKEYLAKKDYNRAAVEFQSALRLKRSDAEPYYQLGLTYIAMGSYSSAYAALKKAIELNPKHQQAQIRMAEIMASLAGKDDAQYVQQAKAMVKEVLAIAPNNADALNVLAIAELKLGEPRNAESDLVRALNEAPQDLQASMNLAKIKFYQKDVAGAEAIIKKAIAASPNSAAPVLGLAALYTASGKPDAAEQQYRRAVQIDPKNDLALLSLASLYVRGNRTDLAEQTYKQISALPQPQYKAVHAMFLFQSGKRDQAIAEFEKLAKADPSDRAARTHLVEAYLAVGRLPAAQALLTAALQKNGKDVDALLQRSRIYLAAGDYTNAQKDVAQALHFRAESAIAHYIMARIYQGKGDALNQRKELWEALRLDNRLLPARLELAQVLLAAHAAPDALQVLDDKANPLLDTQKRQLPYVVERNWVLWAMGNTAEFRQGIDQGLAQARTPDLLIQDGLWNLAQKKFPQARAAVEEALKVNPGDVRGLAVLTQTYLVQKQAAMAIEKVKEYAALSPKSAPAQEFLGNLLATNGKRDQARLAFAAAKAADPRFVDADLSLVQLDVAENKKDDAKKTLNAVLSKNSGNMVARLWLASIADMQGNYDDAIENFRKVVEADPANAQALNNLAYLLSEYRNQTDEALKYAQKAVELAPDQSAYCDTLGWTLYRRGLYTEAVPYLERASADKSNVTWKYHLAMAYAKSGDLGRGRTTLDAALKLNPNLPLAKTAQQVVGKSH